MASKILLDSPAANPVLGYSEAADALGRIIQDSEPHFAVGIFGGWGSGKTTFMEAIKSNVGSVASLVVVDFNAWKFEREPQLFVPLLDTIRAGLIRWAKDRESDTQGKVHESAGRIGRVVRALATGLSAGVGLPGAATVTYDFGAALNALSESGNPESAQSVYFAAFQELEKAFQEFRTGGIDRVVVFVDDIDRCLPENALEVLESMKVFFNLEGFIFIVGLDPDIVGRAVGSKFRPEDTSATPAASSSTLTNRLGREYIQKIFQVQYRVPPVYPEDLENLLGAMLSTQPEELQATVLPYLKHLATDGRMNPREVKRLVNDFILETTIKPRLRPETILALRILQFPHEWAFLYNALLADPIRFQAALQKFREGDHAAFGELTPQLRNLPESARNFLLSPEAQTLTPPGDLRLYLSSLKTTNPWVEWFYGATKLIAAITASIQQVLDDNRSDPVAALRATGATFLDSATDLSVYLSTAESTVPEEFYVLQRMIEHAYRVSTAQEVDEDVARELIMDLQSKVARAQLASATAAFSQPSSPRIRDYF